ncbi:MAG: PAS domain S-box protein [Comamonadaceae bacterium]|nr:PAS domain S-box protein [Comamonadaceae bacterium]
MPRGRRRFRAASRVTVAVILLGMAVTMVAVFGVTRRLHRVGGMLAALAQGERPPKLPARGAAEIADLCRTANEAARKSTSASRRWRVGKHASTPWPSGAYHVEAWFNPQGRLVWINRSIERVTGYSPLECVLAGNLIEMLVCQKDRAYAEEEGRKALAGTPGDNLELRLQRKDGNLVWVAVSWHGIHDAKGRYLGLRVSLDDIQARKEAEMRLLETVAELRRAQDQKEFYLVRANEERARLGALLDVMEVGVMFSDRNRRVLFCNKALYRIWGVAERASLTGVREETLLERTAPLRAADAAYRQHVAAGAGADGNQRSARVRAHRRARAARRVHPGAGRGGGRVHRPRLDLRGHHRSEAHRRPPHPAGGTRSPDQSLQPAPLPGGAGAHAGGCGTARGAAGAAGGRPGRLQADQRPLRTPGRRHRSDQACRGGGGDGAAQRDVLPHRRRRVRAARHRQLRKRRWWDWRAAS